MSTESDSPTGSTRATASRSRRTNSTHQASTSRPPAPVNHQPRAGDHQRLIPFVMLLTFTTLIMILFGGIWLFFETRDLRRGNNYLARRAQQTTVFLTGETEFHVNQTIYTFLVDQAQRHANHTGGNRSGTDLEDYGYSRGHLRAALRLASTLNTTVNPCDDFYEYVCGTWLKENPIPDHLRGFNFFQQAHEQVLGEIEKLMQPSAPSSSKGIEKMRLLYRSCLVENAYQSEALERAQALLQRLGRFPMLEGPEEQPTEKNTNEYGIRMEFLANILKENLGSNLFSLEMEHDMKNISRRIVTFYHAKVPIFYRDVWLNKTAFEKEWTAYRQYLKDMLSTFAQDMNLQISEDLDKQIDELFEFYAGIAKIMIPPGEDHNITAQYNMEKFSNLVDRFEKKSGLNLRELYKESTNNSDYQAFISDENLLVNIPFPRTVDEIAELIQATPSDVLINSHMLGAFFQYSGYFPEKYYDMTMELAKVTSGQKAKTPRWRRCAGLASGLRDAYSANYVRKHFSKETKAAVEDLVVDLKSSFGEILDEADWMDEKTKEVAKKKVKEMLVKIGYDKKAFDDEKLDEIYEDWQIEPDMNFMEMYDRLQKFYTIRGVKKFLAPYDREEFNVDAAAANAYAYKRDNAILFPAGILRPPFFDRDYPAALNYGSIGTVIGHEITHNFDDGGRLFDELGNLNDWWTSNTTEEFEHKAQCMIDQYSAVEIEGLDGIKVNGNMTIGEDIADNGGVLEALRAYRKYLAKNGREKLVPGYNFSNEQLFWIGYGQNWCANLRKQEKKRLALSDEHSPVKVRTNVVVSNQPEFAKAFNCPRGSPMNPDKKCSVW